MAGSNMRSVFENPMYMGMLIEYVREGAPAPNTAHQLFARFIEKRLRDGESALHIKYEVSFERLHRFAELVSFVIVADPSLGLNPRRKSLLASVQKLGSVEEGGKMLDALETFKLARGESDSESRASRRFTFSHRRFQEYFATNYVRNGYASFGALLQKAHRVDGLRRGPELNQQ